MRQRNPSHFGSYCQPSSSGISRTRRASIGGKGGWMGRLITELAGRSERWECARIARNCPDSLPHISPDTSQTWPNAEGLWDETQEHVTSANAWSNRGVLYTAWKVL